MSTQPVPRVTAQLDPSTVALPRVAVTALRTVPDYDIDPLLLVGLRKKLAQAIANEKRLGSAVAQQQGEIAALNAKTDRLRTEASRSSSAAQDARRQFRLAVSASYMSGSGISPGVDAMLSSQTQSPDDVMYSATVMNLYARGQGALVSSAVRQMDRASAAAAAELEAADRATTKLLAIQRKGIAAQQHARQVRQQLRIRIASVRRDLRAKQAAQLVQSGASLKLWSGYLTQLGSYGVTAPSAAALADPNRLPPGLSPVVDAAGVKQAGMAQARTARGQVLVLPREVVTAIGFAYAQLGKPYVWGATGPNSYDCSGLTLAAFRAAGITAMPRTAAEQYAWTMPVPSGQEMPGDLVFFQGDDGTMTHPGHVALVIDPVRHLMIQAPQTGDVVKISNYSQWGGLVGFGRVTTAG